jgi:hypothetical protein
MHVNKLYCEADKVRDPSEIIVVFYLVGGTNWPFPLL